MSTSDRRPNWPAELNQQQPHMRAEAPASPPAEPPAGIPHKGPIEQSSDLVMGTLSTENPLAMSGGRANRPYRSFTFPVDVAHEIMAGPDWSRTRSPADLEFGMTTITLKDELAASKDPSPHMALLQRAIVMIGGKKNLDYTYINDWLNAIGPKGRSIVGEIYQHMNTAPAKVGNAMMATASGWQT